MPRMLSQTYAERDVQDVESYVRDTVGHISPYIGSDEREQLVARGIFLVSRMAQAVWSHPAAGMLLQWAGKAETTHMWTDAATGLECKCRPDWLTDDGSIVVDLKTTKDASPRGFKQSVANYRYHVQAAWYLHGLEQATSKRPDQFIFICVETTAPYAVAVYAADAEMIERGHDQAMRDLAKLAVCKAADHWPSYSDQIETISLPGWMTGQPGSTQTTETIQEF